MSAPAIFNSAGNCFAVVDGFVDGWPGDPAALAREVCRGAQPSSAGANAPLGAGGTAPLGAGGTAPLGEGPAGALHGLLLVGPPRNRGDARMRIYNSDGSRAEMCGNGLRCIAKLLFERGHVRGEELVIETDAGHRRVWPQVRDEIVHAVKVEIGLCEVLRLRDLIEVNGRLVEHSHVSVGNPHVIVFVDDLSRAPVASLGPALEHHRRFPGGTNVQFAEPRGSALGLRTWERGVGETPACGTGAAAAAVAAIRLGLAVSPVWVQCPGGTLEVEWGSWGSVLQTGAVAEGREGARGDDPPVSEGPARAKAKRIRRVVRAQAAEPAERAKPADPAKPVSRARKQKTTAHTAPGAES